MNNFQYVTEKQASPIKKDIISLLNLVQNEVRQYFSFQYEFIGSASRNMITYDPKSNVGFDFDVNIRPNDDENKFEPKEIKKILMRGFDKHNSKFKYDFCEDSKRVITIKVKDRENSKILHSCDFAIVHDYEDDDGYLCQEYIHFNKKQNTYEWQEQPDGFYELPDKIEWCKENNLWQQVRKRYLVAKNKNTIKSKKSRSIFAETINNVCNQFGYFDEEYDDDNYYDDED